MHHFYESYTREIIFHLFEYPLMSYHQYKLYIDKTEDDYLICKWMESFNKPKKYKVLKIKNLNEIIDNNKEEKKD